MSQLWIGRGNTLCPHLLFSSFPIFFANTLCLIFSFTKAFVAHQEDCSGSATVAVPLIFASFTWFFFGCWIYLFFSFFFYRHLSFPMTWRLSCLELKASNSFFSHFLCFFVIHSNYIYFDDYQLFCTSFRIKLLQLNQLESMTHRSTFFYHLSHRSNVFLNWL